MAISNTMPHISNQAGISNSKLDLPQLYNNGNEYKVLEFPVNDPRTKRLNSEGYIYMTRGDRGIFNKLSNEIQEQAVLSCNGITDLGLEVFKTKEDALKFASIINSLNKTIECISEQYFLNSEFR